MEGTRSNRRDDDSKYVREMRSVLRRKDVAALRDFLARSAEERDDAGEAEEIRGIPDADLEARMHKMIMARKDLDDLHASSREWLIAHGFTPLR
jgi:hypothetical protein